MRATAFLFVMCAAGCAETIPDFGIDRTPPTVVSITPADGATNVDREASVTVTFSEAISPESVDETSVQVRDGATLISGSWAVVGSSLTFSSDIALADLRTYEIHLSSDLRDRAGLPFEGPFDSTFVTEDLEWQPPIAISQTAMSAEFGSVAVDALGRVLVVWANDSVVWSQLVVGGEPEPKQQVDTGTSCFVVGTGVADDGTAIAAWTKLTGGRADMLWSRRTAGSWMTPALLESDDAGSVGAGHLAVNASGQAVVAWNHFDSIGPPFRLNEFAKIYSPGSGWSASVPLESSTTTAEPPELALSDNGSAIVTWVQGGRVHATHYDVFDGWSPEQLVDGPTGASRATAHVDADGYGLVVWGDFNRYVPGDGWKGVGTLPGAPGIGVAALGNSDHGILAWTQLSAQYEIRAASLSQDGTIGTDLTLGTSESPILMSGATIDDIGRSSVVWIGEVAERYSLLSARASTTGEWSPARLIENDDVGEVQSVVSMDTGPNGETAILYRRFDGVTFRLWLAILR